MHAAALKRSERLQRVDQLLADGREYSTLDIVQLAGVCAVNSVIAELRQNGRRITCTQRHQDGELRWFYRREDL